MCSAAPTGPCTGTPFLVGIRDTTYRCARDRVMQPGATEADAIMCVQRGLAAGLEAVAAPSGPLADHWYCEDSAFTHATSSFSVQVFDASDADRCASARCSDMSCTVSPGACSM